MKRACILRRGVRGAAAKYCARPFSGVSAAPSERTAIYANYWASMAYPETFREKQGVEPCLVLQRRNKVESNDLKGTILDNFRKRCDATPSAGAHDDPYVREVSIEFRGDSFHEDYLKHFEEHVNGLHLTLLKRMRTLRRDGALPAGSAYALFSHGPRRLPVRKRVLTTQKSPFIFKKSQEQFVHTQKAWKMAFTALELVDGSQPTRHFVFPPRAVLDDFCARGVSGVEISYDLERTVTTLDR